MAGPYRYFTQGMWQREGGVWVRKTSGYVVDGGPIYGYNNWQEFAEAWYQRGGGATFDDWVKLGYTDKYVTVDEYTPENVTAITKTGAHNNYESRLTWTNPPGSTAFDIIVILFNHDDPSYSGIQAPGVGPGDTSIPFWQSGSAAGQDVDYSIHYRDSNLIDGPPAYSNTVLLNFAP